VEIPVTMPMSYDNNEYVKIVTFNAQSIEMFFTL